MEPLQPARQYYIDWIRVSAFLVLIFFHCAMPFVRFGWEIKNEQNAAFLDTLILWLHQWRLPLLFFISGVGVSLSLHRRSVASFFGERVVRLLIPLLFAMFFVIPLQVYYEWLQEGKIEGNYWHFYPTVWQLVPYPEGTLTWSHMWFVVYLFVFTIFLLPVFTVFKMPAVQRWKQRQDKFLRSPLIVLIPAVLFIIYYYLYYIRWPEQGSLLDDWFVFNSSITFYLVGFLLGDLQLFGKTCEKYRRHFLAIVLVCITVLIWKYYGPVSLPKKQDTGLYTYGFFNGLHIWTIILTIVGYSRRYLNFSNRLLEYMNPAVYPFYILHQTVIVAAGYYVTQWNLPIAAKLIILMALCFTVVTALYHIVIRRFWITRLLYGLKLRRKKKVFRIMPETPRIETKNGTF